MKRLLAVCYGGGHVAMMLPVLEQLRLSVPDLHVDLLALTTARAAAQKLGWSSIGYAELLAQWPDPEAQRHGERLLQGNTHPEVTRQESVAYLGLNWMDLVCQHGVGEAQQIYAIQGRRAFYPLMLMRRLIEACRPDFVLTTNSPRTEQAAVQVAVEKGIPCMSMFDLFPVRDDPYAHRNFIADITTVISDVARDTLLAAGIEPHKLAVVGNPAFDELFGTAAARQGRDLLDRLRWHDKWVAMFAGYSEPSASLEWPSGTAFPLAVESELRRWVDDHPDVALVIRQHPNHAHLFREHWGKLPVHPRVHISWPYEEPLEPWIVASQVVVVQASTVGLQAAVAGKPVLALEQSPSIAFSGFGWSALGIARGVKHLTELGVALNETREHPFKASTGLVVPAGPRISSLIGKCLQSSWPTSVSP